MSVFVKIQRFKSQPRLIRVRTDQFQFGEDPNGIVTLNNPTRLLASFKVIGNELELNPHISNFAVNSFDAGKDTKLKAGSGDTVTIEDYDLTFFISGATSEMIAQAEPDSWKEIFNDSSFLQYQRGLLPEIKIVKDQQHRSYPLFPNINFVLGSGSSCSIVIGDPNIASEHCSLMYDLAKHAITITQLDGLLKLQDQDIELTTRIVEDAVITIPKTDIKIEISFGALVDGQIDEQ